MLLSFWKDCSCYMINCRNSKNFELTVERKNVDNKNGKIAIDLNETAYIGAWLVMRIVKNFQKNIGMKGQREDMEAIEKVWVTYNGTFCDELSIKVLYENKGNIDEFEDENGNTISKSAVADWIMENYYNDRKFMEYCKEGKGKIPETAEQLYLWNEEYRKSVDEERLYVLFQIGVAVTKVANLLVYLGKRYMRE